MIVHDPYLPCEEFEKAKVEQVDLETLLRDADYVTLHTILTKETHHLIDEARLHLMKENAYLINTSRGPLIDKASLYKALKEGWIAGAALDVLEEEPVKPDNPLLQLDNIIITPHMAWYSEDVLVEVQRITAENIAEVLRGEVPKNLVK